MPIYTLTNIPSMRAQRYLGVAQRSLNTSLERLASGKRINKSSDDPAGMLMATRFTRSIQAWGQGAENLRMCQDMLNTADSFTAVIKEDIERLNELSNQAANGMLSNDERKLIDMEFQKIVPEVQRLATNTKYLGRILLDGTLNVSVQAGEGSGNVVAVSIPCMTTGAGGLGVAALTVSTQAAATAALAALSTTSFTQIADVMAQIGSNVNAFEKSVDATDALVENLTSARGRIENADLAKEVTNLTNSQIIVQSGISALVQANSAQTLALALLGG